MKYDNIYIITKSRRDLSFLSEVCDIVRFKRGKFDFFADDNELVFFFPDGREIKEPPNIYAKNILNFDLDAITIASNKIICRRKLEENNICIPKTWYRVKNAKPPYIIRQQYHSMGQNIEIVKKEREHKFRQVSLRNERGLYFSELLDVDKEYRAFVLNGGVFLIFDRDWQGSLKETLLQRDSLRTNNLDFNRREASDDISEEYKENCIKAMKAIGLDYGAVDFVIDKKGKMYILELNTRPFMDGKIVQDALKKAFQDLKEGIPLTPFKYEVE